ncbi:hypothetical protein GRF59_18725 [Paenibacillus sp. HJL G12]|uniref:Thiopeptide-type bacteriocin biosynthesis domain-containing protein n=1 Tax=Paenibacillus dendrobii TaxID=2691084 RepID=A0A7X3LHB4_9BACL|nr:thiopeptide-type bacteriocin biosynthesis protein [Paenibacillus dendrobii]MWV45651.1 hypothetical protein [Paenibacillus dendrobii]
MESWKSDRIYYQNYANYDGLIMRLAERLEKLVEDGRISKWFFLRYWEDGPHIRIRYLSEEELAADQLFDEAKAWIKQHPTERKLTKEEYFRHHKFDGDPLALEQQEWYEEGDIIAKPYEPEYDRYGGKALMPLTETLFLESSRLAVLLLKLMRESSFTARLLVAMTVVQELAEGCFENMPRLGAVQSYYRKSADSWKRLYRLETMDLPDRLVQGISNNPRWKEAVVRLLYADGEYDRMKGRLLAGYASIGDALEDEQQIRAIIYSHLHMLNNRLGIGPEYEYALYETLWSLGSKQEVGLDAIIS